MKILSLRVTWAMAILTGLGIIAVLTYAVGDIAGKSRATQGLKNDRLLATIATSVGNMTHELQKERGATSGFIASGGTAFVDALPQRRTDSDAVVAQFMVAVTDLRSNAEVPPNVARQIAEVEAQLASLSTLRAEVDSLNIARADAVGQITAINRGAIGLLPELSREITYSDASRAVQRHAILMTAKDVMGLERAVGAAVFAQGAQNAGVVPEAIVDLFNSLVSEQDTLVSIYAAIASETVGSSLEAMLSSEDALNVADMRSVARSGVATDILEITPEVWFQTITGKINLMKNVEDAGAAEINAFMESAIGNARSEMRNAILHVILDTGGLLVLSAALIYFTSKYLSMTANRVAALAEGDIDSPIVQAPQKDLAKITSALAQFQAAEVERREQAAIQVKLEESSADGIRRISAKVAKGEFEERLRLRDLQGASFILGQGINEILGTAESFVNEKARHDALLIAQKEEEAMAQDRAVGSLEQVVSAYSSGDFSQRMAQDGLDGVWLRVAQGINQIASMTEAALNDISGIMSALAEGSLDARMSDVHKGTFHEIAEATNASLDKLNRAFTSISDGASQVGQATSELRDGSSVLTSRSDEQAKTVADSASATKQLSAAIEENSVNLGKCNDLMLALQSKTAEGQSVAREAIESMSGIEAASSEMEKIVATIEEIAFQTNLLALNASVEAARAGDAGKGFAVVASEVRGLANRCAEASRQIGELISDSVTGVEQGATNVRKTGEAISDVEETLKAVQNVIDEVLVSGETQSQGVATLSSAIAHLDKTAQSNVDLARDNMRLTETLSDQETSLSAAVSGYLKTGMRSLPGIQGAA